MNTPNTTPEVMAALHAMAVPDRAEGMLAYHKVPRPYIGVPNGPLDDMARSLRAALPLPNRLTLAGELWYTNSFEGRVLAAKLLTQARMRPDDGAAWALIQSWLPDLDSWAIADHAMIAGQKRLLAQPARIEDVAQWVRSPSHWVRRAAMVVSLPYARIAHPKPADIAIREQVLTWAGDYVRDPEWFIQKSVAWWLRELSRRHPERVRSFMAENGRHMKNFARREAEKHIGPPPTSPAVPHTPS